MLASLSVAVAVAAHLVVGGVDHDGRRLRRVERDPRLATPGDIERLARAHGVREDKVARIADRVASARLEPALVWSWTLRYDGTELADLCRSRLTDDEVREHLAAGTFPALLELPSRVRTT